jgi:hypothetical protein
MYVLKLLNETRAKLPQFHLNRLSRQVESKIGLDDTEFIAATPDTSCIAVRGGTFILDNSTFPSIYGNGRPAM